jgi:hypothetical protein
MVSVVLQHMVLVSLWLHGGFAVVAHQGLTIIESIIDHNQQTTRYFILAKSYVEEKRRKEREGSGRFSYSRLQREKQDATAGI